MRVEVRVEEVHRLLALVGDGDRRDEEIAVALLQAVEDPSHGVLTNFTSKPAFLAMALTTSMSKPTISPFSFLGLERGIGGVGADDIHLGGRGRRGQGGGLGGRSGRRGRRPARRRPAPGRP